MEDLRSYIESGILELYVLGDLSPEERLQVSEMAAKHPEVKAELGEIERSMEQYAFENAVEPSLGQRDRILNSLLTNFGDDNNFPLAHTAPVEEPVKIKDNVVTMPAARNTSFYKYAFAACLGLLILSLAALFTVYSQLQKTSVQVASLSSQNQKFSNTVKFDENQLGFFRDSSIKLIRLHGTPMAPTAKLSLAWSPAKRRVVIDLKNTTLPANDKDHQYQLWALVGGKPVDLGVFDSGPDSTSMKEMKSTALADAFAVTLEPRGGSVNPTMNQMVLNNL